MKMKRLLIFLAVVFAFGQCITAQLFYKIEGNGLKSPSYLFGTHHAAPASVLDEFPEISDALNSTEGVVGEIDMTMPEMAMAFAMQPYMIAPADSTLTTLLTADELTELEKKFQPYAPMPGVTLTALSTMRPMVISAIISLSEIQKSLPGFDPQQQLDALFQKKSKEAGKKVIPLETPEMQAKLLYTFTPITKQLDDLKELLNNPDELGEMCRKLNDAYLSGDLEALYNLTEADDSDPAFMNALLTLRNQDWLKKLPSIMESQPVFIAVGALHLAGKDGLVARLREAGYNVTPIQK